MKHSAPVRQAIEAYAQRDWAEALRLLQQADADGALSAGELELLGTVGALVGEDETGMGAWTRAHQGYLPDDIRGALRCAFWLAMRSVQRGEVARAGGWTARAQHLLEQIREPCPEASYLRVGQGLQLLESGNSAGALEAFDDVLRASIAFGDRDLAALGGLGHGQALVLLGDIQTGIASLDEVMVSVTADEVSPLVAGIVYCAAIDLCQQTYDLRRAQEWTAALTAWCDAQPDLVAFRGQCMAYRAEILQLRGDWNAAMQEAIWAAERLAGEPAAGLAYYRRGELHRLRGERHKAEDCYRRAGEYGYRPEPGLALLRLENGDLGLADAGIRRALDEAEGELPRARLLPAFVDIMLASGRTDDARHAAAELMTIAGNRGAPLLQAFAEQATGCVELALERPRTALGALRAAWSGWQALDAKYEAARSRVLISVALEMLGDRDAAAIEMHAAQQVFAGLGAVYVPAPMGTASTGRRRDAGFLTDREVEVLRLVAQGLTNRAIANELVISEKTVARHVSNIFGKLNVSTRSAATAYAYEHGIVTLPPA
jgi:DNA-binding NarL/FixJ family response regulator